MIDDKRIIGWREWMSLPALNIHHIKAKVDTGARTSALHAFAVERELVKGAPKVLFSIHPLQKNKHKVVKCVADVLDYRWVTDSGGHREHRYVILTRARLGNLEWDLEMTLTNRDTMKFRMLLGRKALEGRFVVDSAQSYVMGKHP